MTEGIKESGLVSLLGNAARRFSGARYIKPGTPGAPGFPLVGKVPPGQWPLNKGMPPNYHDWNLKTAPLPLSGMPAGGHYYNPSPVAGTMKSLGQTAVGGAGLAALGLPVADMAGYLPHPGAENPAYPPEYQSQGTDYDSLEAAMKSSSSTNDSYQKIAEYRRLDDAVAKSSLVDAFMLVPATKAAEALDACGATELAGVVRTRIAEQLPKRASYLVQLAFADKADLQPKSLLAVVKAAFELKPGTKAAAEANPSLPVDVCRQLVELARDRIVDAWTVERAHEKLAGL